MLRFANVLLSIFAMVHLCLGSVYAQAQGPQSLSPQSVQLAQANSSSSQAPSRPKMLTRTQETKLDQTNILMSDMMYFLVLIGMSLFVVSLWRYTPMTLDMRIAMGAATVMLGSELVSLFQTRKKIDAGTYQIQTREDGTVNNMQLDALKKQKESYESLRDYAQLKTKIQMAGAAAFTVAATIAYVQASRLSTTGAACLSALQGQNCIISQSIYAKDQINFWSPKPSKIKGAQKVADFSALQASFETCTGVAGADAATASKVARLACTPFMKEYGFEPTAEAVPLIQASIDHPLFSKELYVVKNHLTPYSPKSIEFSWLKTTQKIPYSAHVKSNLFSQLSDDTFLAQVRHKEKKAQDQLSFTDHLISTIISSAKAFEVSQLGIVGAAAIVLYTLIRGTYKWMDVLIMNPSHRGTLYIAVAAAAGVTTLITNKAKGQAENNIKKIDELVERMERLQRMKVANLNQKIMSTGLSSQLLPQELPLAALSADGKKTACLPSQIGGNNRSECRALEQDIKSSPGIGSFGSVVGNLASLSGRVADGFTNTSSLSAGTIADIEKLSSQSAIANRALRQAQENLNNVRQSNGEAPIDFTKQRNDLLKSVAASVQRELKKSNQTPAQAVAGIGSGFAPTDEKSVTSLDEIESAPGLVTAATKVNLPSVAKGATFDFSFESEESEVNSEAIDEYLIDDEMYAKAFENESLKSGGSAQIVGDRDVSIFKVISVRYMKSGLPRLLDELE